MSNRITEAEFTVEELDQVEGIRDMLSELSPDLRSKLVRFWYDTEPRYSKRIDNSGKDPHEGYIYIIRDPRLPEDRNIIFVGSSRRPWESVQHHIERSTLPAVREYMSKMLQDFLPADIVIRTQEVVDYAELRIDDYSDFPLPEGAIEIPWEIVAYNPNASESNSEHRGDKKRAVDLSNPKAKKLIKSPRSYFTEKYRNFGHPILNKRSGRPKVNS